MVKTLEERFHNLGITVNVNLEGLIVRTMMKENCTDELEVVLKHYAGDCDLHQLKLQLSMLPTLKNIDPNTSNTKMVKMAIAIIKKLGVAGRLVSGRSGHCCWSCQAHQPQLRGASQHLGG